ncbi:putative G1 S-specific cyclin [Clavispora lusitaniae]|uniref:Cyclin-like domain-containing protein n=3 Tax=Clavispora lusitaniae TaxID=36911 RepID=C4XY38_CLAL4|nr:uncharacterized protein CLUG_00861 [Clavispora lusitaniae ATCC 42720]KAF5212807.1 hypothetical protein E0198_000311 [Clavispora lusitaniae]EEQ36738.1 hypothetical protein CLUG_00861 [Clavispora lusitaniae ATCC 42720]KAF7584738.1 Cyclin, N-terminal domain family protein [Clavispora lusitaniae]OVF07997.1 putative G1/S-specific cyclin [Clavispora lusitaniae]QFZ25776.1 putative G1 S-specific cyclin [Clavispora lusitaniae]
MSTSPGIFHNVRVSQAALKASNIKVQLAEYNAHKKQVDEYKLDIYQHLLELDTSTRPNLQLIQQQPEINLRMRPLLLDFLMDVINKLNASKATFPLAVNLIDRYCSVRIVKKQHYQLLGLTALWIACKNLDSKFRVPTLNDLCRYCCNCYDKKLFLEMENHVLKSLKWLVDAPTFDAFIDVYIHTLASSPFLAGSKNPHKVCNDVKIVAIYICELIQFYPNIYFNYTTPKIALLSVLMSCLILNVGENFVVKDFLDHVYISTMVSVVSVQDFCQAFGLLIKVLKCPPPSLKTKYFNEDSRFLSHMKLLVSFTLTHLAENSVFSQTGSAPLSSCVTPVASRPASNRSYSGEHQMKTPRLGSGVTTPKFYPATPISSSISPKNSELDHFEKSRPMCSPAIGYRGYGSFNGRPLPSPADSENDIPGTKRSFEAVAPPAIKRSKSTSDRSVFLL